MASVILAKHKRQYFISMDPLLYRNWLRQSGRMKCEDSNKQLRNGESDRNNPPQPPVYTDIIYTGLNKVLSTLNYIAWMST